MSQTHKGDRKKSGFEVEDHATILKNNIRELSLARNFGLKVRESRTPRNFAQWSEVSRERWREQERQRMERMKWLDDQFLVKARDWIDDDLRRMMHGISAAIDAEADKLGMHTNPRKTCICRIDKGFTWLQRNMRLRDDGTVSVMIKSEAVTRIKRRIRKLEDKVKDGGMPLSDLTNMVKSWTYSRREEMSYPQLRSIELTVLKIYGREAYEQVYDHHERWKAT